MKYDPHPIRHIFLYHLLEGDLKRLIPTRINASERSNRWLLKNSEAKSSHWLLSLSFIPTENSKNYGAKEGKIYQWESKRSTIIPTDSTVMNQQQCEGEKFTHYIITSRDTGDTSGRVGAMHSVDRDSA
ncbi:hypothetical protein TNCV_4766981 [Trichonephila clavipes]|nr:hypothetical protein TNCV_4766981 [Trichonephila clavipes]